MIKVNIWKYWIMKQGVTKFDTLNNDNAADAMMSFDAIYYHTTYSRSSAIYTVIRTHHCVFMVINCETTKFCDNPLHLSVPQCNYMNDVFYIIQHNVMTYMTSNRFGVNSYKVIWMLSETQFAIINFSNIFWKSDVW